MATPKESRLVMEYPLKVSEMPHNNRSASRKIKTAILVIVGLASLAALIWIFNTPWKYVVPEPTDIPASKEIKKDDLIQQVRQQNKLIVGQVLIKASGWSHREEKNPLWFNKFAVRGWTMPCKIDVEIDLSKLSIGSFDLVTHEDGTRLLTMRLPNPRINDDQCKVLQPNELHRILKEGDLDQREENEVQQEAFEQILQNIQEIIKENRTAIEDSLKPSAADSFRSLYALLGIEKIIVEWESDSHAQEDAKEIKQY